MEKLLIAFMTILLVSSTAIDADKASTPKPVSNWPLNEGGGTVAKDISGNKLDGKYLNIDKIEWADGPHGKAAYFKNTTERVPRALVLAPLPKTLDLNKGFTFVAKIKTPKAMHKARQYEILNCSDTYSMGPGFRIFISWGMVYFAIGDGKAKSSFVHSIPANTPVKPDSWYTIAAVFNGQCGKIYVNGVMAGEIKNVAFAPSKKRVLQIGSGSSLGGYGFEGIICDTALYDSALTENEIADVCYEE